jgi:hypothetical protein
MSRFRDALQTLATLRHLRTRRSATEIAQAIQGDYRQEHLFILQQELTLWAAYQVQIAACDAQIEQGLSNFEVISEITSPIAGSPRRKPQDHQPACMTGGKVKNSRTRRVVNRAANAFRIAALAAGKTHSARSCILSRSMNAIGNTRSDYSHCS